jgi:8-hydroxy-5-deazaflavin:NADPH oxidoreductase
MVNIGIIGSGDVARALGKGFIAEGHRVMLGSRDPAKEKLQAWRQEVGAAGSTGSFADAAKFGEMVVVAVRGSATEAALGLAGPANFAGKVVIDATNPLKLGADKQLTLGVGFSDSLGEAVQRVLPGANVVKAFNTVNNAHMHKPDFPGGTPEMFICGDDPAAKAQVAALLGTFGWSAIDAGGIEASRLLEPLSLLGIRNALKTGNWNYVFRLLTK